jgi:hypothetical protein
MASRPRFLTVEAVFKLSQHITCPSPKKVNNISPITEPYLLRGPISESERQDTKKNATPRKMRIN